MILSLTEEQTYQMIAESNNKLHFEHHTRTATKFPARCLKCWEPIFISYRQNASISVFCKKHMHCAINITDNQKLLQQQYLKKIKEKQLEVIERQFVKSFDNKENNLT